MGEQKRSRCSFLYKCLNYKIMENMTATSDGMMGCISIEICIEKR